MSNPRPKRPNDWDVEQYEGRHAYVWNFGASLIEILAPQPAERILDLGCGPGQLTAQIAESGAIAIGLDKSPAMIAQARINYPKLQFRLADGASFRVDEPVDAVFSNAALHWMKQPELVATCVWRALKPGGRFVAEFGGQGNVRAIVEAISAASGETESQWYFPSIGEYATLLERVGFAVTNAVLFDRPTPLAGEDGLQDWIKMFADPLLALKPVEERPEVIQRVEETVRPKLFRDGVWYADYKRLRIIAHREP